MQVFKGKRTILAKLNYQPVLPHTSKLSGLYHSGDDELTKGVRLFNISIVA